MPSPTDRIEKQIQLNAPLDRVWKALTDYKQFGEWFRVNLQGPFVSGEYCRGNILHPGYEHVVMEVKVGRIEPQTYFSFYWHPYAIDPQINYSDETPTLVEFKLESKDGGVLLQVTESGFDQIPADRRDEAFRMNSGGWTAQLNNNIKAYVEK
jgi:uncharacterized protein YndB with AHSA1/START domain